MFNFSRELSPPHGEQIRVQLGSRYYLLTAPWPDFECHWHRHAAGLTVPLKEEMNPPPCETDDHCCWQEEAPLPQKAFRTNNLPFLSLPDHRHVWCIPPTKSFGSILRCQWSPIVERAKLTTKPILQHAYEVTLAALQYWKRIGATIVERRRQRAKTPPGGIYHAIDLEEDPSGWDLKVEDWVFIFARHLYEEPTSTFRPFEEAPKILASVTGFGPQGIQTSVRRSRAKQAARKEAK